MVSGTQAKEYEEFGEPMPSINYPSEIETVKNNIKITKTTENIFDYENTLQTSINGLTSVLENESGYITTTGKPTKNYVHICNEDITDLLEDGENYTLKRETNDEYLYLQISATKRDGSGINYIRW